MEQKIKLMIEQAEMEENYSLIELWDDICRLKLLYVNNLEGIFVLT
jgi:hypothetical protein